MCSLSEYIVNALYSFINYNTKFKVVLTHTDAKVPRKADIGCAGYDVFSVTSTVVYPGKRALVPLGIKVEVPLDFYLRIAPRSGLSVKGIDIGAGVVDSSYRGEVKVLVINNTHEEFYIERGSKIAQIILERCSNAKIQLVDELSETERGYGGFGSTGD